MQWIDEVAGIVAHRHAGSIVTTACVDNLNFKAGAYLGDTVVLIGRMTYVGKNVYGSQSGLHMLKMRMEPVE